SGSRLQSFLVRRVGILHVKVQSRRHYLSGEGPSRNPAAQHHHCVPKARFPVHSPHRPDETARLLRVERLLGKIEQPRSILRNEIWSHGEESPRTWFHSLPRLVLCGHLTALGPGCHSLHTPVQLI